jgi:DNA invertase Pin-like site-specific DNA recombinase
MTGQTFGYARVSTDDQDLSLQIDALTKADIPKSQIFKDKMSGSRIDRPGLSKCLEVLNTGDVLDVGQPRSSLPLPLTDRRVQ